MVHQSTDRDRWKRARECSQREKSRSKDRRNRVRERSQEKGTEARSREKRKKEQKRNQKSSARDAVTRDLFVSTGFAKFSITGKPFLDARFQQLVPYQKARQWVVTMSDPTAKKWVRSQTDRDAAQVHRQSISKAATLSTHVSHMTKRHDVYVRNR